MTFHFGDFALDPERRELRSGSKLFAIEPQVFDLLEFLIRHRDRVVSRDDLLAGVWSGRIVSESAIGARINAARRAIGDNGVEQRWIRTAARKGFRFVGDVQEKAGSGSPREHADAPAREAPNLAPRAQEVKFCRTKDGVHLAYASVGQGLPIVRAAYWMSHIEYEWQSPVRMPLLHFLADRFRLIRYDCRNNGLSDWDAPDFSFETVQHDLECVVDALGLRSYVLLGISLGVLISIAHAARFPERVSKLILLGGSARGRSKWENPRKGVDMRIFLPMMRDGWGDEHSAFHRMLCTAFYPAASDEQIRSLADLQRVASSPENAVKWPQAFANLDLVDLLPQLSMPTLVMHCRHDNVVPFDEGRRIATLVPHAKFIALESANHIPMPGEPAYPIFLDAIETFLSEP